jgi:hypothetical protein
MSQDRFASLAVRPPIELAVAASARPPVEARDKYLRDWTVVKRARFNAAKRFERKQDASTLAFVFAGVIGFLLPVYTLLFTDVLSIHTKNVLDFTAYVTGALSLLVGLIEQAKDYPAKARRFDQCARRVNVLVRRLAFFVRHPQDLFGLIEDYERALEECGDNHDGIDYAIALAHQRIDDGFDADNAKRELAQLRLKESITIYGLYASIWLLPLVVGVLLWWALYPETVIR